MEHTADWRALTGGETPWADHDVVILGPSGGSGGTAPRQRNYEVYIHERLMAMRPRLDEAKEAAEKFVGASLTWSTYRIEPEHVVHYFFGPTVEFGSPTTIYVGTINREG
jgi:hypothetical protein